MTQTRAELLAFSLRMLRICSGFLLALFVLLLWGRLQLIDVLLVGTAGLSVSCFLLFNDQQVIRSLQAYFRHKASSNSPAEATPTSGLIFSETSSTSDFSELLWLVSSAEKQASAAYKQLKFTNEYLHDVIHQLPLPLILLNSRGHVQEFNERAKLLFGHLHQNKPIAFVIRNNSLIETINQVIDSGAGLVETQWTFAREDKQHFSVIISSFLVEEKNRTAVMFIDRTAAIEAEKMRTDFVANVSHELRTPLTSIMGFVETLQGPAGQDEATREKFLKILLQQSQRMLRLVADQLSLSKIERSDFVPDTTQASLTQAVERVQTALDHQVKTSGARLNIVMPPTPVIVAGAFDELIQMIQNLTENALRYGRPNGQIDVTIKANVTHQALPGIALASISIADDGEGIAPNHLPRLTERFYRVDKGRSREMGGTGLGLAIVKHIVSRHRGHLEIESVLGQGSCFTVYLPCDGRAPDNFSADNRPKDNQQTAETTEAAVTNESQ